MAEHEQSRPSRAERAQGFDALPDAALISVDTWAAIQGVARSTAWARIKTDPEHPRPLRLSRGCTRLKAGDCRAYLAAKQGGAAA